MVEISAALHPANLTERPFFPDLQEEFIISDLRNGERKNCVLMDTDSGDQWLKGPPTRGATDFKVSLRKVFHGDGDFLTFFVVGIW